MSETEEQKQPQGRQPKKAVVAGLITARRLLIGALVLIVILLFLAWYMRPVARVNRKLADFRLGPIPASSTELRIEIGELTYVRFSAEPNTVAQYVGQARNMRGSGGGIYLDQGTPPKITEECPSWFRPALSSYSRFYVLVGRGKNDRFVTVTLQGAKSFLAAPTKNERHAVYILLPPGETGLDRILNWFRSIF